MRYLLVHKIVIRHTQFVFNMDCNGKSLHGISICRVMTKLIQITVLHKYVCLRHYFNNLFRVLQSVDSTLLKGKCIKELVLFMII